jgi:carbonic anhydrase
MLHPDTLRASPDLIELAADQALQRLIEGNERFMRGEARFPTVCKEILAKMARAQHPYCTILGCSDSRVPPELIFDADFGELFIIRVAGNVISREVKGSLQYAGQHLHTPLFLVLGHEGCGAVEAALEHKHEGVEHKRHIQELIDSIVPGLPDFPSGISEPDRLRLGVEANVRWSIRQIMDMPDAQESARRGVRMIGGVYEIATGHVRLI